MTDQLQASSEDQSDVYDKVFELAGLIGKAQFLIISISYLVMLCAGWQVIIPVFAARDVGFICADNFTNSTFLHDTCYEECSHYVYEYGISSITQEFNLDCGPKKHYSYFVHSSYWLGYLISNIIAGYLGDKTGRKPTCVISLGIYFIALLGTYSSPNIELLLMLRLITGLTNGGSYSLAYLIAVECTGEKHLGKVALLSQIFYGLGGVIGACMGYFFIASWRLQIAAIAGIIIIMFPMSIFCLPESPRWLYCQGKLKESEKVLKWICKLNQKEVSLVTFGKNGIPKEPDSKTATLTEKSNLLTGAIIDVKMLQGTPLVFNLCSKFRPTMLFLTHLFLWSASGSLYFILIFQAQDIGSNLYTCSILLNLCDLPTLFLFESIDKIGHKRTALWGLLLGSLLCLLLPFTRVLSISYVTVSTAIFAKFLINCSYSCLYLFSPKTFPTVLRSTAMNACFVSQNLAVTIAGALSETQFGPYDCGPYVIYGILGLTASLLVAMFGKETVGITLLNTVEEYNNFAGLWF